MARQCAHADLQCVDDFCVKKQTCEAGQLGCQCTNERVCGEGATCQTNNDTALYARCIATACANRQGSIGCACRSEGVLLCDDPNGAVCVQGICQSSGCVPGTLGCTCFRGLCDAALQCWGNTDADDGFCVDVAPVAMISKVDSVQMSGVVLLSMLALLLK